MASAPDIKVLIESLSPPFDVKGYGMLANELMAAYDQSARGKGVQRHGGGGVPFVEQPILAIPRTNGDETGQSLAYQVCKKMQEAVRLDDDRAIAEAYGAMVYCAAFAILRKERRARARRDTRFDDQAAERSRKIPVYPEPSCCATNPMTPYGCVRPRDHRMSAFTPDRPHDDGRGFRWCNAVAADLVNACVLPPHPKRIKHLSLFHGAYKEFTVPGDGE